MMKSNTISLYNIHFIRIMSSLDIMLLHFETSEFDFNSNVNFNTPPQINDVFIVLEETRFFFF